MFRSRTFVNMKDGVAHDNNANVHPPHDDMIQLRSNPLPDDFEHYIPWACLQLPTDFDVVVVKIILQDLHPEKPTKPKGRLKAKYKESELSLYQPHETPSKHDVSDHDENTAKLTATYDASNNMIQLKFNRNFPKPRPLLKLIRMIAQYYPQWYTIVFEPPIKNFVPYEIGKLVQVTNIREVVLDGCTLLDSCYQVLLDGECRLNKLSLARCKITDQVVASLCSHLVYPKLASKSLCILILASNDITDIGVKHIADALRTNRQLTYLNLSDNAITDLGADDIFEVLCEFPLNGKENKELCASRLEYLKVKVTLMDKLIEEYRASELESKGSKSKKAKFPAPQKCKITPCSNSSSMNYDADEMLQEYVKTVVEESIGSFVHPFADFIERDDLIYSRGNNTLQMLNLAYNNLTYLSLQKILTVLFNQKLADRKPKGLIYLCIDGNRLPYCKELNEIEALLGSQSDATTKYPKRRTKTRSE